MKYIYLAKKYALVTNDKFELFYRGIIKLFNPYQYYIHIQCKKGFAYPRYFTYTPKPGEEGSYELIVQLLDNQNEIIEEAKTILVVESPKQPNQKVNILCIGDSLTVNGVWPKEGARRVMDDTGTPEGLGFTGCLNVMGTCETKWNDTRIGYEGYGGWTWKSYCTNEHIDLHSSVWIYTHHQKTQSDQHSIWESNGHLWILETIEENRLKFKRGTNNISMISNIGEVFHHVKNAKNTEDIVIEKMEYEKTNPFWNEKKNTIDFTHYIQKNQFLVPDYIYILLTWNGLYIPYLQDFEHHLMYTRLMLRRIHEDFPNCKVRLLGIQICSVNGGITSNYGTNGPYSDTFGAISTAFHYNEALENLCLEEEWKEYVEYIDTKAQFDSEYNMPVAEVFVNARSKQKEYIGTNGVHPTLEGYLQIGDVFYRNLVHDLNKL